MEVRTSSVPAAFSPFFDSGAVKESGLSALVDASFKEDDGHIVTGENKEHILKRTEKGARKRTRLQAREGLLACLELGGEFSLLSCLRASVRSASLTGKYFMLQGVWPFCLLVWSFELGEEEKKPFRSLKNESRYTVAMCVFTPTFFGRNGKS